MNTLTKMNRLAKKLSAEDDNVLKEIPDLSLSPKLEKILKDFKKVKSHVITSAIDGKQKGSQAVKQLVKGYVKLEDEIVENENIGVKYWPKPLLKKLEDIAIDTLITPIKEMYALVEKGEETEDVLNSFLEDFIVGIQETLEKELKDVNVIVIGILVMNMQDMLQNLPKYL